MSTSRTFVAGDVLTAVQMNSLPQGSLGYAQVVANQAGIGAAITDLTSLSVTATIVAGRRIRIQAHVQVLQNTSAQTPVLYIREGAVVLQQDSQYVPVAAGLTVFHTSAVILPTAAAHTYKLSLSVPAATVDAVAGAVAPNWILVEDIGV